MTGSFRWQAMIVATLFSPQLGCKGDSATEPGLDAFKVEALSPTSIAGTAGGVSPVAPAIRVTDARTGKPQVDVPVGFLLRPGGSGGGSLGGYTAVTDAAGIASAGEWQFSERADLNQVLVVVGGALALTFSATVGSDVAHHSRPIAGEDQVALAGETIEGISVRIEDRFDNPVRDLEVKFTILEGGGTIETEKVTTDVHGVALAKGWRLGETPGANQASASVADIEPVFFRAQGLDSANLKWYKLEDVPLERTNIVSARIGLTQFNACLCGRQQGYFVQDITLIEAGTVSTVRMSSGGYVLVDAELFLPMLDGWTKGSIAGDVLVLDADDPWGDGAFTYTWTYREVKASQP